MEFDSDFSLGASFRGCGGSGSEELGCFGGGGPMVVFIVLVSEEEEEEVEGCSSGVLGSEGLELGGGGGPMAVVMVTQNAKYKLRRREPNAPQELSDATSLRSGVDHVRGVKSSGPGLMGWTKESRGKWIFRDMSHFQKYFAK